MGTRLLLFGLLVTMLCSPYSMADSIKVGDKVYEDVIVINDKHSSFYFIQIPIEGKILSEFKTGVKPEDIVITQDEEKRNALIEAFNRARAARRLQKQTPSSLVPTAPQVLKPVSTMQQKPQTISDGTNKGTAYIDESGAPVIKVKGNAKINWELRSKISMRDSERRRISKLPPEQQVDEFVKWYKSNHQGEFDSLVNTLSAASEKAKFDAWKKRHPNSMYIPFVTDLDK